ncbi:ribonuclease 3 [Spirochaetia bacterium]|nr:ribonuclease 3 [Spirochaetia bacterium]GHU33511.1 ribonuclease 3 [Spirochaetia bacterium]
MNPARYTILYNFQSSLELQFRDLSLLDQAVTHRSCSNESGTKLDNERMEFLGDSVLGLVTAALLYERFTEKPEGELAKLKSILVSERTLAAIARSIALNEILLLGQGEEHSGGRSKDAILADALEALFGAVYLDSGYETASTLVGRLLEPEMSHVVDSRHIQDYKSLLQEWTQGKNHSYPWYRLVSQSGPDHERTFQVEVEVDGRIFGPGIGKNKKNAEQEAARIACGALDMKLYMTKVQ